MRKYVLKMYDDGKIIYYKTFKTEKGLLTFANALKNKTTAIQGPIERDKKIIYWIDDKLTFNI